MKTTKQTMPVTNEMLAAMAPRLRVWLDDASLKNGVTMVVGINDHAEKALRLLAKRGIHAAGRPEKLPAHMRDIGGCDVRPYTDWVAGRDRSTDAHRRLMTW